jgi:hypothetical protein
MNGKLSLVLMAFILLLFGCQKGDVGPAGPAGATGATGAAGADANQKNINGAFAGTITGKKKDGSALKETFNYTYAYQAEGYTQSSTLDLYRYDEKNNIGYMTMSLIVKNKGLSNQSVILNKDNDYNTFRFAKETSTTSLYEINGELILSDFNVVIPIDTLKKSTYPLDFTFSYPMYSDGTSYAKVNFTSLYENNQNYFGFPTVDGATVYFGNPNNTTGSFYKIVDAAGNVSSTSSIYGGLSLDYNINNDFIFYGGGKDISLTVPMKADTYSITNYKYDTSTATLSFNYTMRMGGYPFPNSTRHPLTITGTFTGKVYDSITYGRIGTN